jgi:hypothetical protein
VHDASGYQFDAPVAEARSSATSATGAQPLRQVRKVVAVT